MRLLKGGHRKYCALARQAFTRGQAGIANTVDSQSGHASPERKTGVHTIADLLLYAGPLENAPNPIDNAEYCN